MVAGGKRSCDDRVLVSCTGSAAMKSPEQVPWVRFKEGSKRARRQGRSLEEVMLDPEARRRPRPSRDPGGHRQQAPGLAQEARCEQAWARGSATSSEPGGSPPVGREGQHARAGASGGFTRLRPC